MTSMEQFLQLGEDWALDQSFDFSPLDDPDTTEAQDGLPEFSIKSETLADTQMDVLLDMCTSPNEGSLETEWMEQSDLIQLLGVPLYEDASVLDQPLLLDNDLAFSTLTSAAVTTVAPGLARDNDKTGGLGHVFADEFLQSLHKESSLQVNTPPLSPDDQVAPEIMFDTLSDLKLGGNFEFLQSPPSPDDVESVLSSVCSLSASPSPSPSPVLSPASPSTLDTTSLYTESWSFDSHDLYKVVENKDTARPTPYSRPPKTPKSSKSKGRRQTASISPSPSELELELMSKKDRKKLQNKNAAIRYRMKKKVESDVKTSEVDDLESINISLCKKCEELQREVKCMKDLINDIRKARGQAPLPITPSSLIVKTEH